MRQLLAFVPLVRRPAMIFWGALVMAVVALLVNGLAEPGAVRFVTMDVAILACLGYPFVAGLLSGGALREFQHGSFAWALPGAGRKTAIGFVACGLALSVLVAGITMSCGASHHPVPLVAIGLTAYCLGAVIVHPTSSWAAWTGFLLILAGIGASHSIGRFCDAQPIVMSAVLFASVGFLTWRLFRVSTFREMLSHPTASVPGAFSLARSPRRETRRAALDRTVPWTTPLRGRVRDWVKAATYETHGMARGKGRMGFCRGGVRGSLPLTLLFILLVLHACFDHFDQLPGSIATTIHDTLFRPPHLEPLGENVPHKTLAIWIASIGAGSVFSTPLGLRSVLLYPIARWQRARVAYRGSLQESAAFTLVMGLVFLVVGYLGGWSVGHEYRADFVPVFVRPLLATLVLLPSAQYLGMLSSTSDFNNRRNALPALIVGFTGFVVVVLIWTLALPPAISRVELVVVSGALVVSQLIYRYALQVRFLRADLA